MADIQSGYITRGKIEADEAGTHFLLQARDVDADRLTFRTETFLRFNPKMSRNDVLLQANDLLFMTRGSRNYTILINDMPGPALAAASFFIIRVHRKDVLPAYLFWYLNQAPVDSYLQQHSGRGVNMPVVRRTVLENVPVPIPPFAVQEKVAGLDGLLRDELELLRKLSEKRKEQISAVCLQAVRDHTESRKSK